MEEFKDNINGLYYEKAGKWLDIVEEEKRLETRRKLTEQQ